LSSSDNVFIRLTSNSDMTWDRYVAPFSNCLWLVVAIAVCVLSVCLALTNYGHYKNYGHDKNDGLTVPAILFYVFGCLCQQGETSTSYFSVVSLVCLCLNLRFFLFSAFGSLRFLLLASRSNSSIILCLSIRHVNNLLIPSLNISIFIFGGEDRISLINK